ncbi:hypothetical protein BaRGS_00032279 [Batillaria attramentaria]|uniref:Uncharacterized protein n=1 Tax=Batillaria attramentaria TaxID=370345 RepID=A0ABD0JNP2_9CAEN
MKYSHPQQRLGVVANIRPFSISWTDGGGRGVGEGRGGGGMLLYEEQEGRREGLGVERGHGATLSLYYGAGRHQREIPPSFTKLSLCPTRLDGASQGLAQPTSYWRIMFVFEFGQIKNFSPSPWPCKRNNPEEQGGRIRELDAAPVGVPYSLAVSLRSPGAPSVINRTIRGSCNTEALADVLVRLSSLKNNEEEPWDPVLSHSNDVNASELYVWKITPDNQRPSERRASPEHRVRFLSPGIQWEVTNLFFGGSDSSGAQTTFRAWQTRQGQSKTVGVQNRAQNLTPRRPDGDWNQSRNFLASGPRPVHADL